MRIGIGVYNSTNDKCSNCICWSRGKTPRAGKFPGACRRNAPKVTHLRSVIPQQGPGNQVNMQVVDAESSGWPTTMEDDSCFEHVPMVSQ